MRLTKLSGWRDGSVLLRITLLAGLVLFVIALGFLTVFGLINRGYSRTQRQEDSFSRLLREYDISARLFTGTEREYEKLGREIDKIEKKAIGVESWLSVIKRRRELAKAYKPAREEYLACVERALKAYPFSQPLSAIAAASIVKDSAINAEKEAALRNLLPLLVDSSFNRLTLALHVVLGDFRKPKNEASFLYNLVSDGSEDITVDLSILKILRSDFRGAQADIQSLFYSSPQPRDDTVFFAADYYYDFGDPIRSAELFSRLNSDDAAIRQADALYLAGLTGDARLIWTILAEPAAKANENSLYNLAVTSTNTDEAFGYLEKLSKTDPASNKKSRQFGLIRYSRLLDYVRAIAILEDSGIKPVNYPFIDLELCRRRNTHYEAGRQIAEGWLLLDRHPDEEALYQWTAWLFSFQRYYDELQILLDRTENFDPEKKWVPFFKAVYAMREGDLDEAENLLRSIPPEALGWHIYANLGRILETQLSFSRAIEQYELAFLNAENAPKTASRLQYRIAKCFSTLGRPSEALRALDYALDLDPENVSARFEIDRIF